MTDSKNKHYSDHAWERAAPDALYQAYNFGIAYLERECAAGAARSQSGNLCIFKGQLV